MMIGGISPFYMENPNGPLQAHQLIHHESAEDADLFIRLFQQAVENGLNPNDPSVQQDIFSRGILGGWDALMPIDQKRVTRAVEEAYAAHNNFY